MVLFKSRYKLPKANLYMFYVNYERKYFPFNLVFLIHISIKTYRRFKIFITNS